jgi:hypothetical protein
VEDLDPIKLLQSLLDDRGKVLEKISGIHSALNSIRNSPPLVTAAAHPMGAAVTEPQLNPVGEDHAYDRLSQTLRDVQSQIEERVRPLAQQSVQLEVERLRAQAVRDQAALKDCMERIDQSVLACVERLREYQSRYMDLTTLNERVTALGATPEVLPYDLVTQDVSETITLRLERLHLAGKV